MCDQCEKTLYGCCPDLQNAAAGIFPKYKEVSTRNTMINQIVVQHCVHSGPEFAGCPDEDGELYEDCTLTE